MDRLENMDLPWYVKDDLIDLLEKHPNLFEMSESELKELFSDKYLDAQYHTERACVLENEADAVRKYCNVKYVGGNIGEEYENYKWLTDRKDTSIYINKPQDGGDHLMDALNYSAVTHLRRLRVANKLGEN
jgi:hypothetical protein